MTVTEEIKPDLQARGESSTLTILTDKWSETTALELMRRWPRRQIDVYYLEQRGADWRQNSRQSAVKATLLDYDISGTILPNGTRFRHAWWMHLWELTQSFHQIINNESISTRLVGRIYSARSSGALYLRNFYYEAYLWVFLCLWAQHLSSKDPGKSGSTVVFVSSNPFGRWVVDYLRDIYPHVAFSQPTYFWMLREQASVALRLLVAIPAKRTLKSTAKWVNSASHPTGNRVNAKPTVAVEAAWGRGAETGLRELFWLPRSSVDGITNVLIYFDRPDTPASDEALAAVKHQGWQPLVMRQDDGTSVAAQVSPYPEVPDWGRRLLMLLAAPLWLLEKPRRRHTAYWCWTHTVVALDVTAAWQALFARHHVRIHSSGTDVLGFNHVYQSAALERSGGINLRTDTSFGYTPATKEGGKISPFDVFFVWGPQMADVFQDLDVTGITTLVSCGYPFDYLLDQVREEAKGLRRGLQGAGASKIICFFDSSYSKETHTSQQDVEEIYRALLTEVVENPRLGLVLKPKKSLGQTVLTTPGLRELLGKALATGRCISLVRESSSDQIIYPQKAALASDLAVGYPINTAVIEAVLAGVPGIHIDLSREPGHPFYATGYEKIVFDNLERAMEAIRCWTLDSPDADGLGDHSAVIDRIDPFRDGWAAGRVGQYMTWLLEGFDQGLSRDDVVRQASHLYAEKYGAQHVRLAPALASR